MRLIPAKPMQVSPWVILKSGFSPEKRPVEVLLPERFTREAYSFGVTLRAGNLSRYFHPHILDLFIIPQRPL